MPSVIRRSISRLAISAGKNKISLYALVFLGGIQILLLADSYRGYTTIHKHIHELSGPHLAPEYARMFREQRNAYIAGFSLFLLFALWRLVNLFANYDVIYREVAINKNTTPPNCTVGSEETKKDEKKTQ